MEKLIAWVEIPTADFKRAVKFYNSVFKMELTVIDCGELDEKMACFPTGEGAIYYSPNFKPAENNSVIVSFNVPDSIEKTISRIEKENGKVVIPKTKIQSEEKGYFAVCTDSEGNRIGLYE